MKGWGAAIGAIAALLISGVVVYSYRHKTASPVGTPKPTPDAAIQLPADKHPKVQLTFTANGHEVTVNLSNLHADRLEYNLIYDATVSQGKAKDRGQRGVSGEDSVSGKSTYSQKQLLGSSSSGKQVYHEDIDNGIFELTLRDAAGRSIFNATYPFEVTPGKSSTLTAQ